MFGKKKVEVDEYGDERGEDNELSEIVRDKMKAYTMLDPKPKEAS